jgi:hypothetical protein
MKIEQQGELEKIARLMDTCPKCEAEKSAGEHSQIVCWGECWRGEKGLKYTTMSTEQWLQENTNLTQHENK